MSDWDSSQYLKFKSERTQPAIDLVNRITVKNPNNIIDIGCGPGNSSFELKKSFPSARVLGIDNSENMIKAANDRYGDIEFKLCDASTELCKIGEKFDVVFSNACIQWVPDHKPLLENMMSLLNNGGMLAVQMPMNYEEPIHKIMSAVAVSEKWKDKLGFQRHFYTLSPEEYFDILSEISSGFSIWQTTYFHIMESHDDIIQWYRGTGMRPYLSRLSETDGAEFENDVKRELVKAYPKQKNGKIIFRFPRLFFTAVK